MGTAMFFFVFGELQVAGVAEVLVSLFFGSDGQFWY